MMIDEYLSPREFVQYNKGNGKKCAIFFVKQRSVSIVESAFYRTLFIADITSRDRANETDKKHLDEARENEN